MLITHDDLLEAQRELCKRSFAEFVKLAWPHVIPDPLSWNWHLDAVCEHLEAVARHDIKRLLINVPPGTSKSTLVGVMLPAWIWGPLGRPQNRYIGAAHEQGLAVRDNRGMRDLITSPWFQTLWPIALKRDQNEKLYFENDKKGFRQACAVGSMTGRRGHIITWDDPLNPRQADSKAHRDEAIRILTETVPTRLNDPINSAIIIVMQRLHERDPSGYILTEGLGYEHLCIPMLYEPKTTKTTSIGWKDPRTHEGELLDPVRFPRPVVDGYEREMGSYGFAGQMQQRPAPRGGGMIKDAWWDYYDALPIIKWRGIWVDTAQKTGNKNDYTVLQCWGESQNGRPVLIDQVRGKFEAPELLTQTRAFFNKHKALTREGLGALRHIRVEDKVSGTGLIQTLKKEGFPIVGIQRDSDKISRAGDAIPSIEAGLAMLPRNAAWLSDFLDETSSFPNGAHDDQVDVAVDAIVDIVLGRQGKEEGYDWGGFS